MARAFTRRYVLNHRRGFIENDRTYYCIAVARDSIDRYGSVASISRVIRSDKGIHCERRGAKDNVPSAEGKGSYRID